MTQYDRFGDPIEESEHPPCPNNGMSEDDNGNIRFCPLCRPHLTPAERQQKLWGFGGPPHPRTEETEA